MKSVNRRTFLQASATISLPSLFASPLGTVAAVVVPKVVEPLKLYSIVDANSIDYDIYWDTVLVWARDEDSAVALAIEKMEGEDDEVSPKVLCVVEQSETCRPKTNHPAEELRFEYMRMAGFREEGDTQCECCCRYSMGMRRHVVCELCGLCPDCRSDEVDLNCNCDGNDFSK